MIRIGIDLGGTKTEAVALSSSGRERGRFRRPTPHGDYAATVRTMAEMVQRLEAVWGDGEPARVGVGIPGIISPATGLVKNANSVWLIGQPLQRDLSDILGRPVQIENDANCFAVSEAVDGAGAGAGTVMGVILGTGVGSGLVVAGQCLSGENRIAGEWGHNPLPWPLPRPEDGEMPGPSCYCGRLGCIETFLSGPGFAADYARHLGPDDGPPLDPPAIAAAGTTAAEAALQRYEHRLARALATVLNLFDPEVIVLGGGMSNVERLYDTVPALWDTFVFSDSITTRLCRNKHGDSSGVRGAAWL